MPTSIVNFTDIDVAVSIEKINGCRPVPRGDIFKDKRLARSDKQFLQSGLYKGHRIQHRE